MATYKYRAKYNQKGEKVYEEQDGIVILDNQHHANDAGYYVMPDITPYRSMQDGSMIMGRAQHKAHMKQHKLIEIGNEKMPERKPQHYNSDEVKREIARHLYR